MNPVKTSLPGCLFVVATPIGNLDDISKRARDVLTSVDRILAEDTRHSARLLTSIGASTTVNAYHDHNERDMSAIVVARLKEGENVALICDAGTPAVSDPGYHLLKLAHENGIRVVPVPGPSAVIAALSVCGLPVDRFMFEGFLPSRAGQRRSRLRELSDSPHTFVLLESPHRIVDALDDMVEIFGPERPASVAKEMTKMYESVQTGTLGSLRAWLLEETERRKGEFVLVVSGAVASADGAGAEEQGRLLTLLLEELPLKTAVRLAAKITGEGKNDLYQLALRLNRSVE
ncbi:MAG: 16S rRNA (cytidine(1402)-2'-O)-methyltransferase [Gammaproteobacteria bacterium]|nr:16S rRNA (cytidine(1402)-2'-O)-methyltransferase [Gammaproteobacteria bacterium]